MKRRALAAFSAVALLGGTTIVVVIEWPGRAWGARSMDALLMLGLFAAYMAGSLASGRAAQRARGAR